MSLGIIFHLAITSFQGVTYSMVFVKRHHLQNKIEIMVFHITVSWYNRLT